MKLKGSLAVAACVFMLAAVLNAQDIQTGISGRWATDAATALGSMREIVDTTFRDLVLRSCDFGGGSGGFGGGRQGGFAGGQGGDCRKGSIDGVAVLMDLKADKTRVTGAVISDYVKNEKGDISEGKVTGTKFHFVVQRSVANIKIATNYDGELVDANTITLVRTLTGGKPVDTKSDGTTETLTFHRAK